MSSLGIFTSTPEIIQQKQGHQFSFRRKFFGCENAENKKDDSDLSKPHINSIKCKPINNSGIVLSSLDVFLPHTPHSPRDSIGVNLDNREHTLERNGSDYQGVSESVVSHLSQQPPVTALSAKKIFKTKNVAEELQAFLKRKDKQQLLKENALKGELWLGCPILAQLVRAVTDSCASHQWNDALTLLPCIALRSYPVLPLDYSVHIASVLLSSGIFEDVDLKKHLHFLLPDITVLLLTNILEHYGQSVSNQQNRHQVNKIKCNQELVNSDEIMMEDEEEDPITKLTNSTNRHASMQAKQLSEMEDVLNVKPRPGSQSNSTFTNAYKGLLSYVRWKNLLSEQQLSLSAPIVASPDHSLVDQGICSASSTSDGGEDKDKDEQHCTLINVRRKRCFPAKCDVAVSNSKTSLNCDMDIGEPRKNVNNSETDDRNGSGINGIAGNGQADLHQNKAVNTVLQELTEGLDVNHLSAHAEVMLQTALDATTLPCEWIFTPLLEVVEHTRGSSDALKLLTQYVRRHHGHAPAHRAALYHARAYWPRNTDLHIRIMKNIQKLSAGDEVVLTLAQTILNNPNAYTEEEDTVLDIGNATPVPCGSTVTPPLGVEPRLYEVLLRDSTKMESDEEPGLAERKAASQTDKEGKGCRLRKESVVQSTLYVVRVLVQLLQFPHWQNVLRPWELLELALRMLYSNWINCWKCAGCRSSRYTVVSYVSPWWWLWWRPRSIATSPHHPATSPHHPSASPRHPVSSLHFIPNNSSVDNISVPDSETARLLRHRAAVAYILCIDWDMGARQAALREHRFTNLARELRDIVQMSGHSRDRFRVFSRRVEARRAHLYGQNRPRTCTSRAPIPVDISDNVVASLSDMEDDASQSSFTTPLPPRRAKCRSTATTSSCVPSSPAKRMNGQKEGASSDDMTYSTCRSDSLPSSFQPFVNTVPVNIPCHEKRSLLEKRMLGNCGSLCDGDNSTTTTAASVNRNTVTGNTSQERESYAAYMKSLQESRMSPVVSQIAALSDASERNEEQGKTKKPKFDLKQRQLFGKKNLRRTRSRKKLCPDSDESSDTNVKENRTTNVTLSNGDRYDVNIECENAAPVVQRSVCDKSNEDITKMNKSKTSFQEETILQTVENRKSPASHEESCSKRNREEFSEKKPDICDGSSSEAIAPFDGERVCSQASSLFSQVITCGQTVSELHDSTTLLNDTPTAGAADDASLLLLEICANLNGSAATVAEMPDVDVVVPSVDCVPSNLSKSPVKIKNKATSAVEDKIEAIVCDLVQHAASPSAKEGSTERETRSHSPDIIPSSLDQTDKSACSGIFTYSLWKKNPKNTSKNVQTENSVQPIAGSKIKSIFLKPGKDNVFLDGKSSGGVADKPGKVTDNAKSNYSNSHNSVLLMEKDRAKNTSFSSNGDNSDRSEFNAKQIFYDKKRVVSDIRQMFSSESDKDSCLQKSISSALESLRSPKPEEELPDIAAYAKNSSSQLLRCSPRMSVAKGGHGRKLLSDSVDTNDFVDNGVVSSSSIDNDDDFNKSYYNYCGMPDLSPEKRRKYFLHRQQEKEKRSHLKDASFKKSESAPPSKFWRSKEILSVKVSEPEHFTGINHLSNSAEMLEKSQSRDKMVSSKQSTLHLPEVKMCARKSKHILKIGESALLSQRKPYKNHCSVSSKKANSFHSDTSDEKGSLDASIVYEQVYNKQCSKINVEGAKMSSIENSPDLQKKKRKLGPLDNYTILLPPNKINANINTNEKDVSLKNVNVSSCNNKLQDTSSAQIFNNRKYNPKTFPKECTKPFDVDDSDVTKSTIGKNLSCVTSLTKVVANQESISISNNRMGTRKLNKKSRRSSCNVETEDSSVTSNALNSVVKRKKNKIMTDDVAVAAQASVVQSKRARNVCEVEEQGVVNRRKKGNEVRKDDNKDNKSDEALMQDILAGFSIFLKQSA